MSEDASDKFDKEVCNLRRMSLSKDIKRLEVRVFETLKRITQLSGMEHDGHKETLKAAIISIQKDFDKGSQEFIDIRKDIKILEDKCSSYEAVHVSTTKDLEVQTNKVKTLTRYIYMLAGIIVLYILTGEDLSKVLAFIIKLFVI